MYVFVCAFLGVVGWDTDTANAIYVCTYRIDNAHSYD